MPTPPTTPEHKPSMPTTPKTRRLSYNMGKGMESFTLAGMGASGAISALRFGPQLEPSASFDPASCRSRDFQSQLGEHDETRKRDEHSGRVSQATFERRESLEVIQDSGATAEVVLDSRQVLKAFRLIGGFKGVQIEDLREKIATVRNEQVRVPLERELDDIFARHDQDKNGNIDVIEFERMVNSSSLLQNAIHDILGAFGSEEFDVPHVGVEEVNAECADVFSIFLVLSNVLCAAYALDDSPDWDGWQFLELVFLLLFSIDIVIKFKVSSKRKKEVFFQRFQTSHSIDFGGIPGTKSFSLGEAIRQIKDNNRYLKFILKPLNVLDLVVTLIGWVDMSTFFADLATGADRDSDGFFWSMRRLRILRLVRLLRLSHVIFFFEDLRNLLVGVLQGFYSVLWCFVLIVLICFLWATFLRQSIVSVWANDKDGILRDTFPSMQKTMIAVFRCMALGTDGSCMHNRNGSWVSLLSDDMGILFDCAWILTQLFILSGLLNVIAAMFVVRGSEHAAEVRDSIFAARTHEDEMRLNSLDKLLRTLIYPGRERSDPKDRYAAEVARTIKVEHPDVAEKIPNIDRQVVDFARNIQDSKNLLQNAMNLYESREVSDCHRLRNTPSACTYIVDSEEVLLVPTKDGGISNSLFLDRAPLDAVEVLILQESRSQDELMKESQEVQQLVKFMIYPDSDWAMQTAAGETINVWKQSKGLCDIGFDPGPKTFERVEQKVTLKYNGNFQRNRDYSRLGLIYDTVNHLIQALPRFLEFTLDADGVQVVQIENRFVNPHPLGWRDITLLLKVRVPSSGRHHIMEIQMQLKELNACRKENHRIYEEIRATLPADVVNAILDRLVTDTTLDLGITKSEWTQCCRNKQVTALLDGLGVPRTCRQRMFDLVDIDGSGRVTSSELQEIMRLLRSPAISLELAGCHLRVKDVQRFAQTKLGPMVQRLMKTQSRFQHYLAVRKRGPTKTLSDKTKLTMPMFHDFVC